MLYSFILETSVYNDISLHRCESASVVHAQQNRQHLQPQGTFILPSYRWAGFINSYILTFSCIYEIQYIDKSFLFKLFINCLLISRVNLTNWECVVKRCYTKVYDWPGMTLSFVALTSRQIPGIWWLVSTTKLWVIPGQSYTFVDS